MAADRSDEAQRLPPPGLVRHGIADGRPRPFQDEPDRERCLTPWWRRRGIFGALAATPSDTHLEPDLEDLFRPTVNLFHHAVDRLERHLDDNKQAQRRSQKEQDGSEVRSVKRARLARGLTLTERCNTRRSSAIRQPTSSNVTPARPRSGSMVNHRTLTRR